MKFSAIGIMSGTSLDGLDMAYCIFEYKHNQWKYEIKHAETIAYDKEWKNKLQNIENQSALEFNLTHVAYGHWIGKEVKKFIDKHHISVDFIASHGHTIFHQPEKQLTTQIGSGAAIAAESQTTTICDFRTLDVALKGQGAPLVPIGDKLLFSSYDACLNIGGISNISYNANNKRIAYDISPANMVLNHYANQKNKAFDEGGHLARSGKLHTELFNSLNLLDFYATQAPKSLGKEWVLSKIFPLLNSFSLSIEDILHTFVEHIAFQIAKIITQQHLNKVLITGGGTKNIYLIERIQNYASNAVLIIPDEKTIDYKEALVFAFLGVLRITNTNNCLKSVTGALKDNCGGCIYIANN